MGSVGLGWVGASRAEAGCKLEPQMHSLRSGKGNGLSFQNPFRAIIIGPTVAIGKGLMPPTPVSHPGRIGRLKKSNKKTTAIL